MVVVVVGMKEEMEERMVEELVAEMVVEMEGGVAGQGSKAAAFAAVGFVGCWWRRKKKEKMKERGRNGAG